MVYLIIAVLNVFLGFLFCNSDAISVTRDEVVNRIIASERCENGLASHSDARALRAATSGLANGEAAWVAGYVRFSFPMVLIGCYLQLNGFVPAAFKNRDSLLFSCASHCTSLEDGQDYYIVTHADNCYCMTDLEPFEKGNAADCEIDPNEMIAPDYKNNDSYYMLYSVKQYAVPSDRQCILIHKNDHTRIFARSSSCYQEIMNTGFICQYEQAGLVSGCNYTCTYTSPISWTNAFRVCSLTSGSLINTTGVRFANFYTWYWTGFFRSFIIDDYRASNTTVDYTYDSMAGGACLALIKIGNQLLLDPGDCTENKYYICNDPLLTQGSYPDHTDLQTYTIMITIPVILVSFSVLLICCIRRRKNVVIRNQQIPNQTRPETTVAEPTYAEPGDIDYYLHPVENTVNQGRIEVQQSADGYHLLNDGHTFASSSFSATSVPNIQATMTRDSASSTDFENSRVLCNLGGNKHPTMTQDTRWTDESSHNQTSDSYAFVSVPFCSVTMNDQSNR